MSFETLRPDTVLESDLYVMLDEPLPPCHLTVRWATEEMVAGKCGRPSVVLVRGRCSSCHIRNSFGACAEHARVLRQAIARRGPLDCGRCGTPGAVNLWGLS